MGWASHLAYITLGMEGNMTRDCAVSQLNEKGLGEFERALDRCKEDSGFAQWSDGDTIKSCVDELLFDREFSVPAGVRGKIDLDRRFSSRFDFGSYINDAVGGAPVERDKGLLSWLAAAYLDQLCSKDTKAGQLKIGNTIRYIPAIENPRRYYRHLVLTPVMLVHQLGPDAEWLLLGPPNKHADIIEQIMSRPYIIGNKSVLALSKTLYFDDAKGKPKKNSFSHHTPGSFRRLARDLVPQFEMNHDLQLMSAAAIAELLPEEFSDWK